MSERDELILDLYEEGRITSEEFDLLFDKNGYVIETDINYELNLS